MRYSHGSLRPLRAVAVVAVLALVASACGGQEELSADPEQALSQAVDATFDDSFAFSLNVSLSDAARDRIVADDPSAGPILAFLSSARLTGRSAGGGTALSIEGLGTNFGEMRVFEHAFYLQVNVRAIADFSGGEFDPDEIVGALEFFPLPAEVTAFATAAIRGEWIGLVDLDDFDPSELGLDEFTPGDDLTAEEFEQFVEELRERYGEPSEVLDRFATVTEREAAGDQRVFDVVLDVHAIIREFAEVAAQIGEPVSAAEIQEALAEAPEQLRGLEITIEGRNVTQVVIDVGAMAQDLDDSADLAPGDVRVVLGLSDHGSAASVDRPDATTLTGQQLADLVRDMFQDFLGGFALGAAA